MRTQLINWLFDDVLPELKASKAKPEDVLLKYATTKNLSPALLEALGQIFNTAKTVSYLEKSANRGGTFPIVDVPKLVERYLDTRTDGTKQAMTLGWELTNHDTGYELPECFDSVLGDHNTVPPVTEEVLDPRAQAKAAAVAKEDVQVLVGFAEQFLDECKDNARKIASTVERAIRSNSDLDFASVESDALFLHGDAIKQAADNLASLLAANHIHVKRASGPGKNRLVRDATGLLGHIEAFHKCLEQIGHTHDLVKEAMSATSTEREHALDPAFEDVISRLNISNYSKRTRDFSTGQGAGMGPSPLLKKKPDVGKDKGTNYIDSLSTGLDGLAAEPLRYLGGKAKQIFEDSSNPEQKQVDMGMDDVRQVAMLQNLLTTDDVLSESDPDKVIAAFNTIRNASPTMAKDVNIMRVALRSMVAHDGISPFDVKGLSDAELASQKVDINRKLMNDAAYGGKPLPATLKVQS